jgi:fructose-1,6-bisphosphatase class II
VREATVTGNPIASLRSHLVRTVEEAAIACAGTIGQGDRHHSDQVAVAAMRRVLDTVPARGRVVIGEGERDQAPMLWSGEEFGDAAPGAPELDIAVDPLEGTNLCATGGPGAIAVLAGSERGGLLTAPDIYMEKIMVGAASRDLLGDQIRLDYAPERNVRAIARAEGCSPGDVTVVVLERPRHEELIAGLRRAGARVRLIGDGDLSAGILSAMPGSGIQAAMGSGGAPEGVIAAAALRCLGGGMLGRLLVRNDDERARLRETGVKDPGRVLSTTDLAPGRHLVFCAAGVTDGALVSGVLFGPGETGTETLQITNDPPELTRIARRRRT